MRPIHALLSLSLLTLGASAQLVPRDGSSPIRVASERVDASVEDGLARTTVRQTFVNPHARPLEAVFVFPVPDGAALVDVAMEVGGTRLEGLLAERRRARRIYDDIVRSRRDPALVEEIGRNLFRLSVFPVVPDGETVVELSWIQHVPLADGLFRYVYPLSDPSARRAAGDEVDFLATIRLGSSAPITAVSASREDVRVVQSSPTEALATLEGSGLDRSRDLVVTARVESPQARLDVRTHRKADEDGWFLAVVTPPPVREEEILPRDVILVVDTSGSMKDDRKIEQAKESALWLLEHLRPVDRVNVLRFSSDCERFAEAPLEATPENRAGLAEFVEGFEAMGGTALGSALRAATDVPAAEGRVRSVVLLTDGKPTLGPDVPSELVAFAREGGEKGLRFFPFGVGRDVDSALLMAIAAASRGRAQVFRPGGEVETRLTAFLRRTSSPVISDLALEVEGVEVHDVHPRPLPDLYLGEQAVLTGRYDGSGAGVVRLTYTGAAGVEPLEARVEFRGDAGGPRSVRELFARQKLDFLEGARRMRQGLPDDAYYAALDRGAYSTADEIVEELVATSLSHGVQCAYTSFLVLLEEDRRRLDPRDLEAVSAALDRARAQVRVDGLDGRAAGELEAAVLKQSESGAPRFLTDSPFDSDSFNDVIGVGGGSGGKFGARAVGSSSRGGRGAEGSGDAPSTRAAGLEWLARHQGSDGSWSREPFRGDTSCGCPESPPGPPLVSSNGGDGRDARADVGVTALALLAFLGDGGVPDGPHEDVVYSAAAFLKSRQDGDTGRIGTTPHDHALAALALGEFFRATRSPLFERAVQRAAEHAQPPERGAGVALLYFESLAIESGGETKAAGERRADLDSMLTLQEQEGSCAAGSWKPLGLEGRAARTAGMLLTECESRGVQPSSR